MRSSSHDRQLVLFPDEQIAWETLTEECQQSLCQLLSLLIEHVRVQRQHVHDQQHSQRNNNSSPEGNHV